VPAAWLAVIPWPPSLRHVLVQCAVAGRTDVLPTGSMLAATGSPFGAVAPLIFSSHLRFGRVSASVRASQAQAGTKEVMVTAPARDQEDEIVLYIVDMKALPGVLRVMSSAPRIHILSLSGGCF
jgi:hypothetical protein